MASPDINKNLLDVSQAFETYMAFGGDVDRTALALGLDRQTIIALAASESWAGKLANGIKIREGDPQAQIQINRAVNFVQAHRLRKVLDVVVSHLHGMEAEDVIALLMKSTTNGTEFSARPLADLTKAIEACQEMTSRALGDTAGERPEPDANAKGSSIALQVLAAMNAAEKVGLDSTEVVKAQLIQPPRKLNP